MDQYGKVLFTTGGEKSANLQRTLTQNLVLSKIISVDPKKIEEWFGLDIQCPHGCVHTIVLHNDTEVQLFKDIMNQDVFKDEEMIKWKVTPYKEDAEFLAWVENAQLENAADNFVQRMEEQDG